MKRIIFMGTPQFSVPILDALVASEYEVIAVATQPDRPVGRKKILTPSPVKEAAVRLGIPVYQPQKISGSIEMEELIKLQPDLIVTAAYGQFLPTKLLNAPKYRAINVHASLLPKYRGGAPVHYAIINGDAETGVSIMYMEKKMDAGAILAQRAIPIEETDDVGTMFDKLSVLGRDLLLETLPAVFSETVQPIEQDENLVTFSPNIQPEEERIDWNKSAQSISNQIRGMRPWPVAHAYLNGERCKIWQANVVDAHSEKPVGTVIGSKDGGILVVCGEGSVLAINELQPAGKKKMTSTQYLNGVGIETLQKIGFE